MKGIHRPSALIKEVKEAPSPGFPVSSEVERRVTRPERPLARKTFHPLLLSPGTRSEAVLSKTSQAPSAERPVANESPLPPWPWPARLIRVFFPLARDQRKTLIRGFSPWPGTRFLALLEKRTWLPFAAMAVRSM